MMTLIPRYPYPHQNIAMLVMGLFLLITGLVAFGIYKLITWKMNLKVKKVFNIFLKIVGILIVIFFFAEMTVSLITTNHVNKQLGFSCATPDTPKGELFIITKVVAGKTMDKAGLKPDDQIQMVAVSDLYKLLIDNQGKDVTIAVLRNQKEINIMISVPKLDVPLASISFLLFI